MKKAFTLLMAVAMVIGFAGIAAADCFSCQGTPGNIARGCETGQDWCYPFDFETPEDYCDDFKKIENRAIFLICDCITDGDFDTVVAGDTIDISMEIVVNGETGDNGVYWAEDVSSTGIPLGLYENQDDACAEPKESAYPDSFEGVYRYLLANGNIGAVDDSEPGSTDTGCIIADINRVTKIQLDRVASAGVHGYVVDVDDEIAGNASWAIDIPELRVDPSRVSAGDQVWVRICLLLDCAGICSEDVECCCDIYIGELCCAFDSAAGAGLVYPYFPPADSAAFNLLGMTITNLSSNAGDATVMMYESDGDVGSVDVTIGANGIFLTTIANLVADLNQTKGAGTLGDAKSYITVTTDFPATGFAMIADTVDGASMGYLPLQGWESNLVGFLKGMPIGD